MGVGVRRLGGADPAVLAALVAEAGDLFLSEYATRLAERTGGGARARRRCAAPWPGWGCGAKKVAPGE